MRDRILKEDKSLDYLVAGLCLDFFRREAVIYEACATRRTLVEFRYLNFKIFEAAAEIVGEDMAKLYIKEIGSNVGYAKSEADTVSETTYKRYKKLIKENIAKKLHLSD